MSRCVCSLTCFSRADVSVLESVINQSLLEQAKRLKTKQQSYLNIALVRGECSISLLHFTAFLSGGNRETNKDFRNPKASGKKINKLFSLHHSRNVSMSFNKF